MRTKAQFYQRSTMLVARELLGKQIFTRSRGAVTGGVITEVEAYLSSDDEACHAARGKTPRCEIMFQEGGLCYVYFIYGMYYCVNVVTEDEGQGSAVLIRSLRPTYGIQTMQRRTGQKNEAALCNGPGKLCNALAITKKHLGEFFPTSEKIWIEDGKKIPDSQIIATPRIGISKAQQKELRFVVDGNAAAY
jgi:DNA-3-methyladenine glycosylase